MKYISILLLVTTLISCSKKKAISITLLPNENSVFLNSYGKENIDGFFPYKIEVINNSFNKVRIRNITGSGNFSSSRSRLFLENGEEITHTNKSIPVLGSKVIIVFIPFNISKKNNLSLNFTRSLNRTIKLKKIEGIEIDNYNYLKNKFLNDSIAYSFEDKEYNLTFLKVGRIFENKYCNRTIDEMIIDAKNGNRSIFDPYNCK
ncbi:hypothetical protein [Cellulophaga sp. L1A9]|uniref:hypothetical protein n=1 Tax=Cellulophaga sp. L1A9 TaxID=2686362 RepID=UPI00131E852E|nr:hypothetical protein [Cellulophaga sp. L1A9]